MHEMTDNLKNSVMAYCAKIGADPLLIQGAGGNVSWKENGTLWVKASGTWLAEALEKDIFVPVDLILMNKALDERDFTVLPIVSDDSKLRPSIETQLHALMPHKIVVHVHSVVALAHLVCDGWQENFQVLLDGAIPWTAVGYKKPGAELAEAVYSALERKKEAKVVFLENHGVVIGGENIDDIQETISVLTNSLSSTLREPTNSLVKAIYLDDNLQYTPIPDSKLHTLATNVDFYSHLQTCWALYPDHIVFLGDSPNVYESIDQFYEYSSVNTDLPELIFIRDAGVFIKDSFNRAKLAQLRCYYDVISRINEFSKINVLTQSQIGDLLNWDAEKYRMRIAN